MLQLHPALIVLQVVDDLHLGVFGRRVLLDFLALAVVLAEEGVLEGTKGRDALQLVVVQHLVDEG